MHRDEIIDEVRAARAHLLESAGGDLEALFAKLKELEEQENREVVVLPPRKPPQRNEVA